MKLQDQVISLDLAKRMKELGFKQESLWWWDRKGDKSWELVCNKYVYMDTKNEMYSAHTVAELGEMLPEHEIINNYLCHLYINPVDNRKTNGVREWNVYYSSYNGQQGISGKEDVSLANAMAKMLIYLKEKGL